MNKYALGTIVGTALLGFAKARTKGSNDILHLAKFYTIDIDLSIREYKNADPNLSPRMNRFLLNQLKDKIIGPNIDQEFVNLLKPILFDYLYQTRPFTFFKSLAIITEPIGLWCEDDGFDEIGDEEEWEEMEICKYNIKIILPSATDLTNLPEDKEADLIKKIENIIISFGDYETDRNGYINYPIAEDIEYGIYNGVQDHYDDRNRWKGLAIENNGEWILYEPPRSVVPKLRKR